MSQKLTCRVCNGNNQDMPCAYPEGVAGCIKQYHNGEYIGSCAGCVNDIPGDCKASTRGKDGYLHFPAGYCFEPEKEGN